MQPGSRCALQHSDARTRRDARSSPSPGVDAPVEKLAPLPWDIGQQVFFQFYFYPGIGGEFVVRAEDESLLAVLRHQESLGHQGLGWSEIDPKVGRERSDVSVAPRTARS